MAFTAADVQRDEDGPFLLKKEERRIPVTGYRDRVGVLYAAPQCTARSFTENEDPAEILRGLAARDGFDPNLLEIEKPTDWMYTTVKGEVCMVRHTTAFMPLSGEAT